MLKVLTTIQQIYRKKFLRSFLIKKLSLILKFILNVLFQIEPKSKPRVQNNQLSEILNMIQANIIYGLKFHF